MDTIGGDRNTEYGIYPTMLIKINTDHELVDKVNYFGKIISERERERERERESEKESESE